MIAISMPKAFSELYHDYPAMFIAGCFMAVALVLVFPYIFRGRYVLREDDDRFNALIIITCAMIALAGMSFFNWFQHYMVN